VIFEILRLRSISAAEIYREFEKILNFSKKNFAKFSMQNEQKLYLEGEGRQAVL
jgi:hypothetical protein